MLDRGGGNPYARGDRRDWDRRADWDGYPHNTITSLSGSEEGPAVFSRSDNSASQKERDTAESGLPRRTHLYPLGSEVTLRCRIRTAGGRSIEEMMMVEGLPSFTEETGLLVGRVLVVSGFSDGTSKYGSWKAMPN